YYVWGFLKLFGFNILSYQAALFVIWLTTFGFTLLVVDLFFESYAVTSVTALILDFLPFAFIYTFAGYRYPMATALAVVSLYFLHLGFKRASPFFLSLSGITAGLCLASSISGKQYLLALVIAAPLYAVFYWRSLARGATWSVLALWQKRFEIVLLAIIPVVGAFIATCIENRLLMPIPFWVILMSFTLAGLLQLSRWLSVQILFCVIAALILLDGLIPSVRYIY